MFRFRRVGVSGSSKGLSRNAVLCCQAVGDRLAQDLTVVMPRLLNYIVAIYLIVIGLLGLIHR